MAIEGAFLEGHSYSGGLRHTAFVEGGARPAWAPPADSVGWRDDFPLEGGDVVVEFHQREAAGGGVASWLAVYHRSVDARLGDRGNHAGMGVWLHDLRVVDYVALLNPLNQLAALLARTPDPDVLADKVAEFATDRYLGSYITRADRLPLDWRGAPASAGTLVDTRYRYATASAFDGAIGQVAEEVARLSLDWSGKITTPRALILVTARAEPPTERPFEKLASAGAFLADVLERLPKAFDEERQAVREEAVRLADARRDWDVERQSQQQRWDEEQRQWRMLDKKPASMEGIAERLNEISRQLQGIEGTTKTGPLRPPAPAAPQPNWSRPAKPPRAASSASVPPVASVQPSSQERTWRAVALGTMAVLVVLCAYLLYKRVTQQDAIPPTSQMSSEQDTVPEASSSPERVGRVRDAARGAVSGEDDLDGYTRAGDTQNDLGSRDGRRDREIIIENSR